MTTLHAAINRLLDETIPVETQERNYQLLLIELDRRGIRKLNRNSKELLKHFPEYANPN